MLVDPIYHVQTYLPGSGIDIVSNTISVSAATLAAISGAVQEQTRNLANGFAGLDAQSALNAIVKVQYMTRAEANAQVIPQGVLAVMSDSKSLRFGDGISQGGFVAGLGSESCLYVSPVGTTALENGAAAIAAINLAKTLTPYGLPKSATNRVTVLLGVGEYDFNGSLALDTSFVDLVGVSQQGVRCTSGPGKYSNIYAINLSLRIRNITFFKQAGQASHLIQWYLPINDTIDIYFENLTFEGSNTDTVFTVLTREGGTSDIVTGTCNNVRTNCLRLFSPSNTGFGNHTWAVNMTDCSAAQLVGGTAPGNKPIVTGTWRRCTLVPSAILNNHFELQSTAVINNCDWCVPMSHLQNGARVVYTRFRHTTQGPLTASINGTVAGITAYIAHCELMSTGGTGTTGLGSNLATNNAGATAALAMNVVSDL